MLCNRLIGIDRLSSRINKVATVGSRSTEEVHVTKLTRLTTLGAQLPLRHAIESVRPASDPNFFHPMFSTRIFGSESGRKKFGSESDFLTQWRGLATTDPLIINHYSLAVVPSSCIVQYKDAEKASI